LLQRISGSGKLVSAGELAEARKEFLPFSTAVSEFVRTARHQSDALKSLKLYRCPMAPQPGFWLQLNGPLRNPYFGSEMLTCGSELSGCNGQPVSIQWAFSGTTTEVADTFADSDAPAAS
jgi:hypothetical protein